MKQMGAHAIVQGETRRGQMAGERTHFCKGGSEARGGKKDIYIEREKFLSS
jgi:hypothetical protein